MRSATIVLAFTVLAAPGCATQTPPAGANPDKAAAGTVCVSGTLTNDGVECPAFRAEDGGLYTLTGDLGGLQPGDDACVCGTPAEISFCMQGTTLAVSSVSETCPR
ncbi:MAG: hypothetical protein CMM50_11115 [Rhodospirillaceae bacterium]|nr:hypothetical protein [Rhodospirillaceae bacterium]